MGAGEPRHPRFIAGVASWGWGRAPPGGEEERRQSNKHSRHPGLLLAQTPRSPSVTITVITKAPIHKEPGPSQLQLQELLLRHKQATLPSTIWELANEWKGTKTDKFLLLSSIWAELVSYHQEIYGEISSDLYRLSGCDILNLTFCRLDFHQLLIKIS